MVSMGTYSAWESNATLRLLGGARGAWAPTGGEEGRGILCRHVHNLLFFNTVLLTVFLFDVVPAEANTATMEPCSRPSQPDESKHAASSCMDVG